MNYDDDTLHEAERSCWREYKTEIDRLRKENDFLKQEIGALTASNDDYIKRHADLVRLCTRQQEQLSRQGVASENIERESERTTALSEGEGDTSELGSGS